MIDTLIKLCLLALTVIGIVYVAIDAFVTEKKAKKSIKKPERKSEKPAGKKLEIPDAVRENPDLFVFKDGRVKLRSQL